MMADDTISLWFGGAALSIAVADIHPEIRQRGLPFEIDSHRLWSLPAPAIRLRVEQLSWMLDLPYWPAGGRLFQVAPRAVLARADAFPPHGDKIAGADLSLPIEVVFFRGRWLVLDGLHRLARAASLGRPLIAARRHTLAKVRSTAARPALHPAEASRC